MRGSSQAAAEAGALCDAIRHPDQQDSNGPYGRYSSGGGSGGRDEIPDCKPPKKKKKEAPWPTLITAGGSLPKDPVTWQTAAVLVDKPLGWTSFDVCGKLRSTLRIKKVGDQHPEMLSPCLLRESRPWNAHCSRCRCVSCHSRQAHGVRRSFSSA